MGLKKFKTDVPFVNGFEDVPIPRGKEVTNVSVLKTPDGTEYVQITIADQPFLSDEVLATVNVVR